MVFVAVAVYVVCMIGLWYVLSDSSEYKSFNWFNKTIFFWVVGVTLTVIVVGSIAKIIALAKGGRSIAESMGGRLVNPATKTYREKRYLNIVEEIALASGVPTPQVYILDDEKGINAFAAGYSPNDAIIAVTNGCLKYLNREELQGVIAHEYSHILNGDMRLNIRLIGFLGGIMIISTIGYYIIRYSGNKKSNNKSAIFGLGLIIVGYVGVFFGRIIQSAVSRQREYLADASSVQFTRNPDGIAEALKTIGGFDKGSKVESPASNEICHMFFAAGIKSLFATHPPLLERICRIDPSFTGEYPKPMAVDYRQPPPIPSHLQAEPISRVAVELNDVVIGEIRPEHLENGEKLLAGIPGVIVNELSDMLGALAVVCALLLNPDEAERKRQIVSVEKKAPKGLIQQIEKIWPTVQKIDPRLRLPVVDLAIPILREMSPRQFAGFEVIVKNLIESDGKLELFEFVLMQILSRRLGANYRRVETKAQFKSLGSLIPDCINVLTKLSLAGHDNEKEAKAAYAAAVGKLSAFINPDEMPDAISFPELERSMNRLAAATPHLKKMIFYACARCVLYDRSVTVAEAELLRAMAYALDLPLPPFIPEVK